MLLCCSDPEKKKKKKENIPKLCDLTLKYDQTCLRRLCLVESPQPMNEVLPSRETFPERAPLSRGWSSEHGKLLWAMYLSLPGDLANTDGLRGYQCNTTPPLLWLLKKILPEIKKKKKKVQPTALHSVGKTHHPKKYAFSVPGARSAVIKSSSQPRGTRGTVTPSLNESLLLTRHLSAVC